MRRSLAFTDFFLALWDLDPFPWQSLLAERLAEGEWPKALDLPTAAGKTACMDAAIYALAAQADKPVWERTAPRRIWFVVDRRIVVDEAFDRAQAIADKLLEAKDGPLKEVADRLQKISGTEHPLATARLRGGVLRDDGWARLPSQPAVITSTVDQLGSRLLFRGYGHSARTAPIFAGLAAHDSLILLDEAHLSVPFMQTLRAVQGYRGEKWAEQPIRTPFAFAILSATPPADIAVSEVFPEEADRAAALDHPVLRKRMRANKPAEMVAVKAAKAGGTDPLVGEAAERARGFVQEEGKQRVAVVVNRVATAQAIAEALRDSVGDAIDVVLLTGRLRPFERDALVAHWQPGLKAGSTTQLERPIVLVATQCIEVGADFSFDALVTEAASLDALRQRFGRLNRLGEHDSAPAAFLIRADQAKPGHDDLIYRTAMAQCWALLDRLAETEGVGKRQRRTVNFGIAALDTALAEAEDVEAAIAPTQDSPMLFPAHLDLLCQTSPLPQVQPDIELYLHGPERGGPEVRVVWRADLDKDDPRRETNWPETVALSPPNSLEALSVPLYRLRRWLKDQGAKDDAVDVEGAAWTEQKTEQTRGMKPALIWRGRERSTIARKPYDLRPDDLVVLPDAYGTQGLGQSAPEWALGKRRLDLWELSHAKSGKPPALRLQRQILEPWLDCPPLAALVELAEAPDWEEEELQAAIDTVLLYAPQADEDPPPPPDWLLDLLRKTRAGRKERHPAGGLILLASGQAPRNEEQDLFADDDDLLSAVGKEVPLDVHSALVERAVAQLADRCLPGHFHQPLKTAAYWHDAGKLDERFQIWLRQGNQPAALAGEPLAKSRAIATSPARRHWLREVSGLPGKFRHEMLSLQLAERLGPSGGDTDLDDLVLYCVASHHGYGRPFAPVCPDDQPPPLRGMHDGVAIEIDENTRAAWPAPHALDSGVAERFWRLTRRYGWWGLAYLEAILRLGDWYGSRLTEETAPQRPPRQSVGMAVPKDDKSNHSVVLTGIDGANPLGFLAALGALCALQGAGHKAAKLHWIRRFVWQPVLSGLPGTDRDELASAVANILRAETREEIAIGIAEDDTKKIIDCDRNHFRSIVKSLLTDSSSVHRIGIDLITAFTSDACIDKDRRGKPKENKNKKPRLEATPFQFIRGTGHQYFLGTVVQLMASIEEEKIKAVLFGPWRYDDEKNSMRWDPVEDRRYALMDRDPTASGNKPRTIWMANLLAYRALALFPSMPRRNGLATTGWSRHDSEDVFTWPLWAGPAGAELVRSLLVLPELYQASPDQSELRARGVCAVLRSRRIKVGAGANFKINFSPARQI